MALTAAAFRDLVGRSLDGIRAGIYGAPFPIVVADLTRGPRRFNVNQGAVATAQGMGAALSASLAGLIIVSAGYGAASPTLAAIAAAGFAPYLLVTPETLPAEVVPT